MTNSPIQSSIHASILQLAVNDVNADGQVAYDFQLQLLLDDHKGNATVAANYTKHQIAQGAGVFVTDTNCAITDTVYKTANSSVHPLNVVSWGCSAEQFSSYQYFIRTIPSDTSCMGMFADLAFWFGLNNSQIAVLYTADEYGTGTMQALQR